MKQIGVRFSDSTKLCIDDLAESIGVDVSVLARAAMKIGLDKLKAVGSKDIEQAQQLVLMEDLRAKQ